MFGLYKKMIKCQIWQYQGFLINFPQVQVRGGTEIGEIYPSTGRGLSLTQFYNYLLPKLLRLHLTLVRVTFWLSKRDEGSIGKFPIFWNSNFSIWYLIVNPNNGGNPTLIETEILKILRALPIRGTRVFKLDADKVEKGIHLWRQKVLICLFKKKNFKKVNYILIFRTVSRALTMSIYLRADSSLPRTICSCSRYHASAGPSIFLPRFLSYFVPQDLFSISPFSNLDSVWS